MKLLRYILFATVLLPLGLCGATPSPAQENSGGQTQAYIQHHYEMLIQRRPYSEKVCYEKEVPVMSNRREEGTLDAGGAVLGGIIGAVIGNNVPGANEVTTGFGAIAGSAIGGDVAEGDPKPTGKYRIERECRRESRYKEDRKRVYTHSTVTFWDDKLQRNITLEYQR